jgi:uncharacterized membrane protein
MKQLFGFLLLIGFISLYFWWIVLTVVVVLVARLMWTGYLQAKREFDAEQQARAAECRRLIAAADLAYAQGCADLSHLEDR